ncbi:hypothetical protein [Burkholderia ubonensis]|uniref:hypothetical protein n=1 Tax=Burkholderia ubonensis TaxID=101571 RepID=UPI0012FCCF98|nr:hypothetical protein [Burkholderia ubonensis]
MSIMLAKGDELCCVIEQFAELEWRKFESRTVDVLLGSGEVYHEDHSRFPPFTAVRFKNENQEFVVKLNSAIFNYEGMVRWSINGHRRIALPGTNWVIRPVFVDQLAGEIDDSGYQGLRKHVAEHYPDFAPVAYADLLGLAEHVRRALAD